MKKCIIIGSSGSFETYKKSDTDIIGGVFGTPVSIFYFGESRVCRVDTSVSLSPVSPKPTSNPGSSPVTSQPTPSRSSSKPTNSPSFSPVTSEPITITPEETQSPSSSPVSSLAGTTEATTTETTSPTSRATGAATPSAGTTETTTAEANNNEISMSQKAVGDIISVRISITVVAIVLLIL